MSGYLVSASLARADSLAGFLGLRLLRLGPALLVVVAASVFLLGPSLGDRAAGDYFASAQTWRYFTNLAGRAQFFLPGLFEANARSGVVNGSLWTIPLEAQCYLALGLAGVLARGRLRLGLLAVAALLLLLPPVAALLPAPDLLLAFVCGAILYHAGRDIPRWAAPLLLVAAFALAAMNQALCALPLAGAIIALKQVRLPPWLTRADYSYGLYLTGFPVEQALLQMRPHLHWPVLLLLAVAVAGLLAAGLWHGIERPLLRRKHRLLARLAWLRPVPMPAASA